MYKVIIWGTGAYYSQYLNMIKAQEVEGKLQVVAITSDDNYIHKLDTYVFIPKEKINYVDFEQYIKIKAGNISIISRNCWGEFVTIILG